jgi:hypothetical protein
VPHVSERQPQDGDIKPKDKSEGPGNKPSGELGGHPINADETAPREAVPDPNEDGGTERHPEATEGEPGADL